MLKDKNNDLLHLLSILESIEKIKLYSEQSESAESFFEYQDQLNFNATLTLLMHIGETVGKLSDDLIDKNSQIPWEKTRGLRHRIAHDYVALDIVIIFNIIKNQLPEFLNSIYELTINRFNEGVLDFEELNLAIGSLYYRHIDFQKLVKRNPQGAM